MSIVQTVLVFVGIPALVVAVFALLIFGPGEMRQSNRYRPGKPWTYPPVWYIPRPSADAGSAGRPALEAASRRAIEAGEAGPAAAAVGGASGEW